MTSDERFAAWWAEHDHAHRGGSMGDERDIARAAYAAGEAAGAGRANATWAGEVERLRLGPYVKVEPLLYYMAEHIADTKATPDRDPGEGKGE